MYLSFRLDGQRTKANKFQFYKPFCALDTSSLTGVLSFLYTVAVFGTPVEFIPSGFTLEATKS